MQPTKGKCSLKRSGRIVWDEYQNWAQCYPYPANPTKKTAYEIASTLKTKVESFTCDDCVQKALNDLGPDGDFSISNPETVFKDHDCLVYFLWAWRSFVTLRTGGRPLYWDEYCRRKDWQGEARPDCIGWKQATDYHIEPFEEKTRRFFVDNKQFWAGLAVGIAACVIVVAVVTATKKEKKKQQTP